MATNSEKKQSKKSLKNARAKLKRRDEKIARLEAELKERDEKAKKKPRILWDKFAYVEQG